MADRGPHRIVGKVGLLVAAGAALAIVAGAPATAQGVMPSPLQPIVGGMPGLTVFLELDPAVYAMVKELDRIHFGAFVLDLQRSVDLHLERFEVLAPEATLIVAEGEREAELQRPDVVLLRGEVAGRPGSSVFLSLSPHGSHGYVQLEEHGARQTYIISTPPEGANWGGGAPTVIYNLKTLPEGTIEWQEFTCGVRDVVEGAGHRGHIVRRSRRSTEDPGDSSLPCRRVRVAVETDWEYAALFNGNSAAAQAYISTLMGAASELFIRDANTRLEVVYARVWNDPNDPYTTTNIDQRLTEFRNHWNGMMQSVNRNIAHMLSGLRNGAGGVAWLGVLCGMENSYGISGYMNGAFPYPLVNNHAQNWDVFVVAHEIGHNFKAPHTHEMTPPVDGCGNSNCAGAHMGTIMSYCHTCSGSVANIRLDLHERVVDEHIAPYLDTLSCGIALAPIEIVQQPQPQTIIAGQSTELSVLATGTSPRTYRWRRNNIDLININGISGATSPTLVITGGERVHAGEYTVRVRNTCGEVVSSEVSVTVLEPCYANCDESTSQPLLTIDDFTCFINAFSHAQALPVAERILHYANCDGSVVPPVLTVDDFVCFINEFAAGCP